MARPRWIDESSFVALDLETTGPDPATDRIIQIALIQIEPGAHIGTGWSFFVNPERPIPAEATAVHGITDECVSRSPKFAELVPQIFDIARGRRVCAYNGLRFDMPLIRRELAAAGQPVSNHDPLDPAVWVRVIDRRVKRIEGVSKYALVSVMERWGIKREGHAHETLSDALGAWQVFDVISRSRPEYFPSDLSEFCAAQRKFGAQQEAEIEKWKARNA
jgi:DNA polymerase III epsilon subunit family exonuclease